MVEHWPRVHVPLEKPCLGTCVALCYAALYSECSSFFFGKCCLTICVVLCCFCLSECLGCRHAAIMLPILHCHNTLPMMLKDGPIIQCNKDETLFQQALSTSNVAMLLLELCTFSTSYVRNSLALTLSKL